MRIKPEYLKDEMTPNERMSAFVTGQPIDRIPCLPMVGCHAARLIGCSVREFNLSSRLMAEGQIAAYKLYNHESIGVAPGSHIIAGAMGGKVYYPEENMPWMEINPLQDETMLEQIKIPDPEKDGILPLYLEAAKIMKHQVGEEVGIGLIIGGPVTLAGSLRGTELLLKDMVVNQDFLHRLLELSLKSALAVAKAFVQEGLQPVIVDPLATGSLLSVKIAKEFAFPYSTRMIDELNKITHGVVLHICGNTTKLLNLMADTGAACLSLDNIVDLEVAKKEVGNRVTICGNVRPVETMLKGSPEDVMREAKECLRKAFDSSRGFILSTGCDLPVETPKENVLALMEAARTYGKWPIDPEKLV